MKSCRRVRPAIALFACLTSAPTLAATRHAFEIAAGPLDLAIAALAAQGGIDIGATDSGLAHARTKGVHGRLEPRTALDRLLAGSGYRAVRIDESAYRLVRAAQQVSPRIGRRPPALVATAPADGDGTIIVAASKHASPLLRFPGSVTILRPQTMGRFGVGETRDMHMVAAALPILQTTELGDGRNKLFIRGIADSSFAGPTRSTATVYFGDVQLSYNGADPNLNFYDLDSIEILEGPQGALYGAGSIGGIIRLTPNPPDSSRIAASATSTAGATQGGDPSYGLVSMVNLPLREGEVAVRAVGYYTHDGGYVDDSYRQSHNVNRTITKGGRASLRLTPGDDWTIDLGIAGQRIAASDSQYATIGSPGLSRASTLAQPFNGDFLLIRGVVSKMWDSGLQFLSATGRATHQTDARFDATPRPNAPFAYDTHGSNGLTAQEIRLSRSVPSGNSWLFGLSYIRDRDAIQRTLGPPDRPRDIVGVTNVATDLSAFGEATVALNRHLSLTAGSRLTLARTDGTPVYTRNASPFIHGLRSTRLSPMLAADMLVVPRLGWFVRYGSGFRTGGLAVAPGVGRVADFTPDTIQVIETGLRLTRERPLGFAASASLSHARWNQIQADLIDARGFPNTTNIGDVRITGVEANIDWIPLPGFHLVGSAFLNRSRLANPILRLSRQAGDDLPDTPRHAGRIAISYGWRVGTNNDLSLSGNLRYNGHSYVGFGPTLNVKQGGYAPLDIVAGWKRNKVGLSLALDNVANASGNRFALGNPFGIADRNQRTPMRPRTLRFSLSFEE
ncbi:MAG: TonB-dependent receptor [Rhizorhabdus sp.]|nr:TonB-dependent receptor [Rhizorhabdus sp.]